MSNLLEWIIGAAVAVVVPAILAALWAGVRWIAGIKTAVDDMREGGKKRTEETQTILRAVLALADTQEQTLMAIRDGKVNGNITKGLTAVDETRQEVTDMLIERAG